MKAKKIFALFLCLAMTLIMVVPSAYASTTGVISVETTLNDGVTQKGSKKTFDVIARLDGKKISSKVTLNGIPVNSNWNDANKTSYTLIFKQEGENTVVVTASSNGKSATKTYTITYKKAEKGELIGHATLTVEALTIGRGFIVEPVEIPIYEGENTAQILDRILTQKGYSYDHTGKLESGFYLSVLADGCEYSDGCNDTENAQKLNVPVNIEETVPNVLKAVLEEHGSWPPDELYDSACLGEFDYTFMAGWMYAVNNVFPNVGFSDTYPSDGDVVRVQFTLFGYGADIGGGFCMGGGQSTDFYKVANKDRLLTLLASVNSAENKTELLSKTGVQEEYNEAMKVCAQLNAEQNKIDEHYLKLYEVLNSIPLSGISLNKTTAKLDKNTEDTLTVSYNEENTTDDKTVEWTTSDAAVATVENGKITAHQAGTAVITAKVGNFTASCIFTVPELSVNPVVDEDKETGVKVEAPANVVPTDTKLIGMILTETDEAFGQVKTALKDVANNFTPLDISLQSEGVTIQPQGKIKVTLKIPEKYDRNRVIVYRVMEDGTLKDMNAVINGDTICFETDHLSLYAIAEKAAVTTDTSETDDSTQTSKTEVTTQTSTTGEMTKTSETNESLNVPKTGEESPIFEIAIISSLALSALVLLNGKRKIV